ncbi:MAG: enoyl-CoA hydratase/isomerase family protein [Lysobacterales bacterium]
MSDQSTVIYAVDGAVATVTMNRPDAMNSFNVALRADLTAVLQQADNDEAVRVVVLTGAGRAFSPGADLKEGINDAVERQLNHEYRPVLDAINNMRKPVIAALNGFAAGVGLSVALTSDLVVMGDNAFLLSPFTAISLVPDGGATWLLVRQLGYKRAYQMSIEGERLSAADALDAGLINRVVPADDVVSNAQAWAGELAEKAPLSLAATKRAMRLAMSASYDEAFRFEAMLQGQCAASEDAAEGVQAFLEKRPAKFTGK